MPKLQVKRLHAGSLHRILGNKRFAGPVFIALALLLIIWMASVLDPDIKYKDISNQVSLEDTSYAIDSVANQPASSFIKSQQPTSAADPPTHINQPLASPEEQPFDYLKDMAMAHYKHALTKTRVSSSIANISVIKRVAILGERSSGTNLMVNLFTDNLIDGFDVSPGLTQIKHYYQTWPETDREYEKKVSHTLVVLIKRNAFDWLQAQYRTCYCCEHLRKDHTFAEFLELPFGTSLVNPYNGEKRPTQGCPLEFGIYKKGPEDLFVNVVSNRYEKHTHFLNTSTWGMPAFEIVKWEDLLSEKAQKEWFTKVATKWNLPTRGGESFKTQSEDARFWKEGFSTDSRIERSIYLNHTLVKVDEKARKVCELIKGRIDDDLEAIMGYSPVDCSGGGLTDN